MCSLPFFSALIVKLGSRSVPGQVQVGSRSGPGWVQVSSRSFNIKVYFKYLRDLEQELEAIIAIPPPPPPENLLKFAEHEVHLTS